MPSTVAVENDSMVYSGPSFCAGPPTAALSSTADPSQLKSRFAVSAFYIATCGSGSVFLTSPSSGVSSAVHVNERGNAFGCIDVTAKYIAAGEAAHVKNAEIVVLTLGGAKKKSHPAVVMLENHHCCKGCFF